jgi:hypothetical protein
VRVAAIEPRFRRRDKVVDLHVLVEENAATAVRSI